MSHKQLRNHKSQENTLVEISRFEPTEGVAEYHVMIHVTRPSLTYQEQLDTLLDTYYQLLENELKGAVAVFKRYFLSDAANQADWLAVQVPESSVCACSIVEQPPNVVRWKADCSKWHTGLTAICGAVRLVIGRPIRNTRPACC